MCKVSLSLGNRACSTDDPCNSIPIKNVPNISCTSVHAPDIHISNHHPHGSAERPNRNPPKRYGTIFNPLANTTLHIDTALKLGPGNAVTRMSHFQPNCETNTQM